MQRHGPDAQDGAGPPPPPPPAPPPAAWAPAQDAGQARSLEDLFAEYRAEKMAEGRAPRHVDSLIAYMRHAARHGGWVLVTDATPNSCRAYLATLTNHRGETCTPKYYNNVRGYLSAFFTWCIKRRHIVTTPMLDIEERIDARGEQIRPFTVEEFDALLEAAAKRPGGKLACLVYRTSAWTGLRRSELKALRVCDLVLDGDEPHLALQPYQYKRGRRVLRAARIPLVSRELLEQLREHVKGKAAGDRVFRTVPHANIVNRDVARAVIKTPHGNRPVENPDALGRRLVLHSVRHMLGTNLAIAGVDVRKIQEILRHRDLRTTQRYIDATQLPTARALREVGPDYGGFRRAS